jgi:hypothetical protein
MLNEILGSAELTYERFEAKNRRLTTFSISKTGEHSTVSIVGCFEIKPTIGSVRCSRGTIHVGTNSYIVFDRQAMDGLPPKDITEESCIVLLYEDNKFSKKATAIIVDNTTELLSLLDKYSPKIT